MRKFLQISTLTSIMTWLALTSFPAAADSVDWDSVWANMGYVSWTNSGCTYDAIKNVEKCPHENGWSVYYDSEGNVQAVHEVCLPGSPDCSQ